MKVWKINVTLAYEVVRSSSVPHVPYPLSAFTPLSGLETRLKARSSRMQNVTLEFLFLKKRGNINSVTGYSGQVDSKKIERIRINLSHLVLVPGLYQGSRYFQTWNPGPGLWKTDTSYQSVGQDNSEILTISSTGWSAWGVDFEKPIPYISNDNFIQENIFDYWNDLLSGYVHVKGTYPECIRCVLDPPVSVFSLSLYRHPSIYILFISPLVVTSYTTWIN